MAKKTKLFPILQLKKRKAKTRVGRAFTKDIRTGKSTGVPIGIEIAPGTKQAKNKTKKAATRVMSKAKMANKAFTPRRRKKKK